MASGVTVISLEVILAAQKQLIKVFLFNIENIMESQKYEMNEG